MDEVVVVHTEVHRMKARWLLLSGTTIQRTYFRVNLAYLESLRELRLSTVQIEGLLLTGGLEAPGT